MKKDDTIERHLNLYKRLVYAMLLLFGLLIFGGVYLLEKYELKESIITALNLAKIHDKGDIKKIENLLGFITAVDRVVVYDKGTIIYEAGDKKKSDVRIQVQRGTLKFIVWGDFFKLLGKVKYILIFMAIIFVGISFVLIYFISLLKKRVESEFSNVVNEFRRLHLLGDEIAEARIKTNFREIRRFLEEYNKLARKLKTYQANLKHLIEDRTKQYIDLINEQKRITTVIKKIIFSRNPDEAVNIFYKEVNNRFNVTKYAVYVYNPYNLRYTLLKKKGSFIAAIGRREIKELKRNGSTQVGVKLPYATSSATEWNVLLFDMGIMIFQSEREISKEELSGFFEIFELVIGIVLKRLYLLEYWREVNRELREKVYELEKFKENLKNLRSFRISIFYRLFTI